MAVNNTPTSVRLGAKLGSLTLRAAFSHIPFLHSAQWMLNAICLAPDAPSADLAAAAAAAGQVRLGIQGRASQDLFMPGISERMGVHVCGTGGWVSAEQAAH